MFWNISRILLIYVYLRSSSSDLPERPIAAAPVRAGGSRLDIRGGTSAGGASSFTDDPTEIDATAFAGDGKGAPARESLVNGDSRGGAAVSVRAVSGRVRAHGHFSYRTAPRTH